MAEKITPPTLEDEQAYNSVVENEKEEFRFRKGDHKWKVGWTYHGSLRKVSSLMASKKEDEDKVTTKCAAAILCDSIWKLWFFYWILWRWMYYIKGYSDSELAPLIELAQKKIPLDAYSKCIMLLIGMKDTKMIMTRKELESMVQGRKSELSMQSQKKDRGSQNQGGSSSAS